MGKYILIDDESDIFGVDVPETEIPEILSSGVFMIALRVNEGEIEFADIVHTADDIVWNKPLYTMDTNDIL